MATSGGRVVIVGGGIIGLSVAFHLGRRGHRDVVVLDRGAVGEGATAAATGGIRRQFSSPVNIELSLRSMPFWTAFQDVTGRPLDFRRHGYLLLLSGPDTLAAFTRNVALQRRLGVPVALLQPDEVDEVFPGVRADDLLGATYTPGDGSASPADAVAGLLHGARSAGVEVRQGVRFLGVDTAPEGTVRTALTSDGPVEAAQVVIAAGPQAGEVGRRCGVDLPVRPHSRQAFATGPLPDLHGGLPLTVDMATGAYVHPQATGGTAVIGGSDRDVTSTTAARVDWGRIAGLAEAVSHRFPGLAQMEVTGGWAGLREMTPDDHGVVGPIAGRPGLWVAAGFSGHGFMHAPAVGEAVARWLLDGDPGLDLHDLRPDRFAHPPAPGAPETGAAAPVENAVF